MLSIAKKAIFMVLAMLPAALAQSAPDTGQTPTYGLHGPVLNIFGGAFVGLLFVAFGFGVISVQLLRYFAVFPDDPLFTRLVVLSLWLVNGFELAVVGWSVNRWLAVHWGNPIPMAKANWEFAFYQDSIIFASLTVQSFFAWRIYSLSKQPLLGAVVELMSLIQFGFGLGLSIRANEILVWEQFSQQYNWLVVTWLALQASVDVLITAIMVVLLWNRKTGFKKTDRAISFMIRTTINTGFLTTVISLVTLGFFAKHGFHYAVLTIGLPLGCVYTVSLMSNLHSRKKVQAKLLPTILPLGPHDVEMKSSQGSSERRRIFGPFSGQTPRDQGMPRIATSPTQVYVSQASASVATNPSFIMDISPESAERQTYPNAIHASQHHHSRGASMSSHASTLVNSHPSFPTSWPA